jgi:hypothetical protein
MIRQNFILSYNNCNEITQTQDETSFITNNGVNDILHVHSNRVPTHPTQVKAQMKMWVEMLLIPQEK